MNFKKYSVTDFICNEDFQEWVIKPNEENNRFWNNWLFAHPAKKDTVNEAKRILLNINFREDFPTDEQVKSALEKNMAEINLLEEADAAPVVPAGSISGYIHLRKIAAILIVLLLISLFVLYSNRKNETITVATNYSETKNLVLKDGTEITLNGHSSVTYLKHPGGDAPRQVKLQGEAFFKVNHLNKNEEHIKNSERFIVSAGNVKVEVLGTSFDVKNRRNSTSVVLARGKVKVSVMNSDNEYIMKNPGEMVAYDASLKAIKRSFTDPVTQSSWINKKLIREDASVSAVAEYIEDNYGYKVIFKDAGIADRKMEGTLLLDNFQDVLFILSTSLDIRIRKVDSTLIFSK